jgi:hypothetical protein
MKHSKNKYHTGLIKEQRALEKKLAQLEKQAKKLLTAYMLLKNKLDQLNI